MRTVLLVNQVVGPLFLDFTEAIVEEYGSQNITIICGNPADLKHKQNIKFVKSLRYSNKNILQRLMTWFGFSLHVLVHLCTKRHYSHVLVTSNAPTNSWFVAFYGFVFGSTKFHFLCYDMYPEVVIKNSNNNLLKHFLNLIRKIDTYVISRYDTLIVLTEQMRTQYLMRKGLETCIKIIPLTGSPLDLNSDKVNKARKNFGLRDDELLFLYSGNFGKNHDFETILSAIYASNRSDARYIFMGDGAQRKVITKAASTAENIDILPFQEIENYNQYLLAADYCFVTITSSGASTLLPSKIATYAMSGAKVLGIAPWESAAAKLINKEKIGYTCEPKDVDALKNYIDDAIRINKSNALNEAVNKAFSRSNLRELIRETFNER